MSSIKLPTLTELMAMFFKFHLEAGWINPDATIIKDGFTRQAFACLGPWTFCDEWLVHCFTEDDWSCGKTTISHDGKEVFRMTYAGRYTEEAIEQAVKPKLRAAYQQGQFWGGRGEPDPWNIVRGGMRYENGPEVLSYPPTDPRRMKCFSGFEQVRASAAGKVLGFHQYQGLVLSRLFIE